MEKSKIIRLAVLAVLMIAIIVAAVVFLNQKTYAVLYSGMEAADAGEVLTMLSEMGVDAKTKGDDTILVADDEVDKVRLELAAKGYPSSGVNYDIYSSASGLGTTDSEKEKYYQFQLQANLENTIEQMDQVEDATVYIDLGEDSSFVLSDNEKPATASVMLTLRNGETLNSQQVRAITELVSKSVSGLDADNIRIVDSQMTLYTSGEEGEVQTADSQLALQNSVQEQLREQIINLLSPVFGEDNVLAQVSVTLNFDSTKKESVEYSLPADSPDGIVVSMQELVEAITNDADGEVAGIDANGSASEYLESLDESDNAVYYNISREVNYEVNQTTTQIEKAQGQIEDLSVSVILNSASIDDYVDEVKNLVSTAIGSTQDHITVERLPFEAAAAAEEEKAATQAEAQEFEQQIARSAQSAQTLRYVIIAVAAIVALIFLFSIIKLLRPQKMEAAGAGGIDIMVDDQTESRKADAEARDIEIKEKDSNLEVLEEYIGKNPESVANLLRNWLNEE
jgi:flagellar M-ring protein FliF